MVEIQGRVAVVTGAGSGIGQALAVEFARRGARLAISDIDPRGLEQTAALAKELGAPVHAELVDVSDATAVEEHAARVVAHYGAVHLVVNNAGIAGDTGVILDEGLDTFERVLRVNLWGVIHGTTAFLPHLVASGDGHLVNVSSINGFIASPSNSAYITSKFAVRGFTEAVRADLISAGAPVTVSVVHPGGVATEIANSALERVEASGEATAALRQRVDLANKQLLKMPPAKAATIVADGIVAGKPRILVGTDARMLDAIARLFPRAAPALMARMEKRLFPNTDLSEIPDLGSAS